MLRTNPLFLAFIEDLYQKQTATDIVCRKYSKGKLLYVQGDAPLKVSIVKDGLVKCYRCEENGKDYTFEFMGRGEIVGEMEVLLPQNVCFGNIEALSDVEVYSFTIGYFNRLCDTNPKFCRMLLSEMAQRMINTSSRAAYQQLYPIKYALIKLLTILESQKLNLSKAEIASYLGVDVRSLNRVLKEFHSCGTISL